MSRKFSHTVWILEDDPGCQFIYRECLDQKYELVIFESLEAFSNQIQKTRPDLLLVDLKLKDGNFLNYLRSDASHQIAQNDFIVISSSEDIEILRTCFEHGASDYLTKPFTRSELTVKIERLLSSSFHSESVQFDGLLLEPVKGLIKEGFKKEVQLTLKEMQLFSVLCQSKSTGITRDEVYRIVWKDLKISPKTFDVHLVHLRRKLAAFGVKVLYDPEEGYRLSREHRSTSHLSA